MDKRVGFIGIILEDREMQVDSVNRILFEFAEVIIGRIGLPYKERGCSVITLIVDATTDEVGAITGKLGKIEGISVKSALSKGRSL